MMDAGQLASHDELSDIIGHFPQHHLMHAFGYGSGVFSQNIQAQAHAGGMIDMILVVDDAHRFHEQNIQQNPQHYTPWLRWSGPAMATTLQRSLPDAKVLFHVVDDPVAMKYGIVQWDDLRADLLQWNALYLAGRLHKPTLPIMTPVPDEFVDAQETNLRSAVAASLLLLDGNDHEDADAGPSKDIGDQSGTTPWSKLYMQIASLSYTGDFRMKVGGEDPLKVTKLIQAPGQLDRFHSMYRRSSITQTLEAQGVLQLSDAGVEWDCKSSAARRCLWECLPPSFQALNSSVHASTASTESRKPLTNANANANMPTRTNATKFGGDAQQRLMSKLEDTVGKPARYQSMKGIFTLGFSRSFKYAAAKLSKGLLRRR